MNYLFIYLFIVGNETGTLPNGEFNGCIDNLALLNSKILVVGAGGLGCEILKNLSLSGFTNIEVVDLDTIDITNLNRQFLFRKADVGRAKAEVAAEFVMKRVKGCNVKWHKAKIQEFTEDFYRQFKLIVCGLDNIEARRWLNQVVVSMARITPDGELEEGSVIIPIIDGGTEGFKGQSRVVIPKITSCLECSMELFTPQVLFQICTISNTPRTPEHCIAYAYMIEWESYFPKDKKLNKDSPDDMKWIYEKALSRAQKFGINGVTYFKTLGVVKSIIPAIASTNAIISAAVTNEALKLITFCGQTLNNWYAYSGDGEQGIYTNTYEHSKKEDCLVCSLATRAINIPATMTVKEFRQLLCDDSQYQLKSPSIRSNQGTTIYISNKIFDKQLGPNLEKPLSNFIKSGEIVLVTDEIFKNLHANIHVNY